MADNPVADNPVLADSGLPYDLPDFAAIGDDDFLPAYELALTAHLAEVEAIATDPAEPTFANTVAALEASGRLLARANGIFFNLEGADTNPQRAAIAQELAVRLTEHRNTIALDPRLFARIESVYERRDDLALAPPQRRLTERRYRDAVRAGAGLDADGQEQMRQISARLATLTTEFSQKLLEDTNASAVQVLDAADLDGLSAGEIAAAARAAQDRGLPGYLITLELPTSQASVAALTEPAVRQRVFQASVQRCARGGANDTRAMILEIVTLRARRARLLGYRDHADYVIAEETAPDPEAVAELLRELGQAAMAAVDRDLAAAEAAYGTPLNPSDVTYALALAQAGADDEASGQADPPGQKERSPRSPVEEFTAYCELDNVLNDGVFAAAGALYGLTFTPRPDLRGYHPDVRIWEVKTEAGEGIGLFLGDFYARPSKRGGAWMNSIVDQSRQLGSRPVIVNVLNLTEPEPGQPCLLTQDQLVTVFHEFGHAVHGLLSAVDYVSQSGTSVPRDFVEFPSQVNEMWALHPQVVSGYARHWRTGEPAPAELIEAVRAAGDVEPAHATVEYLAAAALDLAWHRLGPDEIPDDVLEFEAQALAAAGLAHPLIPPRYRSTYFNHVFGGGYSSAYYSYIWSEILDAETQQWFLAGGGLQRALGAAFAEAVLSVGDSVDPVAAHAGMLGRTARIEPLLRRRGLVTAGQQRPAAE
ncbi:peptidyl-dipeptidase Dcp [Gordonia hirsuta DSM 44140 = NBRC 16056]|uniref:Peptidyl-dipeptidase Dcp n=1 Tax=Gordonia hirsuta DSM 44140 = NBRC 16056 TaxID=1121927 RepID=L7LAY4_9ACTN|nr:M3 family metallopeptidase [Gordonia hirsuta]GAC57193.1 peptidyl-dipeptidase Dcp [Gordonia hirsuta DSM 44140 = NBRC 16056]